MPRPPPQASSTSLFPAPAGGPGATWRAGWTPSRGSSTGDVAPEVRSSLMGVCREGPRAVLYCGVISGFLVVP